MALAGFTRDEIDVTVQDNMLIIIGRAVEPADADKREFLHRGIAKRAFERRFQLADTIKVTGAGYENGLLNVELVREALQETATEALRAGQIVHRLRDFVSRGESSREIASLHRLVTETTALALLDVNVRNTDFVTRFDPSCDAVLVDPVQVQQVLLNLMRNAFDATAEMPVKQLIVATAPSDGDMVRVTVSDSGPGISSEIADRLFQPFVSTKDSGMGLGLSICHTIAASHGGKIWAEPSELGGTAFHFTLMSADTERQV